MNRPLVDRHGIPITTGVRLRIKHCTGRYGQTAITEGTVRDIDSYSGVSLVLSTGQHRYIPLRVNPFTRPGFLTAADEHHDVDHAHETWAEVLPTVEAQP